MTMSARKRDTNKNKTSRVEKDQFLKDMRHFLVSNLASQFWLATPGVCSQPNISCPNDSVTQTLKNNYV